VATLTASNTVSILGAGTATLTASQPGNSTYAPATPVTTTLIVNKASQKIAPFAKIASQVHGTSLTVTPPPSSSGLQVIVTVKSGPATPISGNQFFFTAKGSVVLVANQPGNGNYLSAPPVTTTISVK
jgi:hypothetical protein